MTRTLCLLFLILSSRFAIADDTSVLSCRLITERAKRLDCYDAIPTLPAPTGKPSQSNVAFQQTLPQTKIESFGKDQRSQTDELHEIETTIPGAFYGWSAREKIKLANGQTWKIVDDSNGALNLDNPRVKISRGLFGTFFLEIEGTNRSPKVARVE